MARHLWPFVVLLAAACATSEGPPCFDPAPDTTSTDGGVLLYSRDVKPVIDRRCGGCHVQGGIAPFPLTNLDEVTANKASVKAAVLGRVMPPWMPDESCVRFKDSRRLQNWEIQTITQWVDEGCPDGAAAAPPAAEPPALPWVDVSMKPATAYTPDKSTSDDYHCFLLDPTQSQDHDIVGFDIVPGERRVVHHVLLYSADRTQALKKGTDWHCGGGPGTPDPKLLGGWVPGSPPTLYPTDTGVPLEATRVVVMQVHYNLTAGDLPDQTQVRLMFSKQPVPKPATILGEADFTFAIPAGAQNFSDSQTFRAPKSTLWGVLPHMHMLGTHINVMLGDTPVIDVPSWDFHWQQFYFYEHPIQLGAGTPGKLTCTWTNPGADKIRWGEGTGDEMCLNYFYLTE